MNRMSCAHAESLCDRVLFAAKTSGDFAQQLILFLPPRFQCPREDLLKMIAIVHGGVKENNVGSFFGSGQFVLQGRMTIDCQRNRLGNRSVLHRPHHLVTRLFMVLFQSETVEIGFRVGDHDQIHFFACYRLGAMPVCGVPAIWSTYPVR